MNLGAPPPKVSVCVVTYNQEDQIAKCIESVLNQDTCFSTEIIVSDDCSSDRTSELLRALAKQHPGRLRLFIQDTNIGALENYRFVHRQALGEYVAHLDGDDYFLPGKLAKQTAFLDEHANCPFVAHIMHVMESGRQISNTVRAPERISLTYLLLNHPVFLNSSMMYRRRSLQHIFSSGKDFIDFYVYVAAAKIDDIGFLNEQLGGYNANIGISSGRKLLPYIEEAIEFADDAVPGQIKDQAIYRQRLRYAYAALRRRDAVAFQDLISKVAEYSTTPSLGAVLFHLRASPYALRVIVGAAEIPRRILAYLRRLS